MKPNITIVGLAGKFKKNVAIKLADKLDMIFADVSDMMEFNLVNSNMLEIAGQDYFDTCECKTLKQVEGCENAVVNVNMATLCKKNNVECVKNRSYVIYIKLVYEQFKIINELENYGALQSINLDLFNERDSFLSSISDIEICVEDMLVDHVVDGIIMGLKNIF